MADEENINTVTGTQNADNLSGTAGQDNIFAGDGDDYVQAGLGNDYVEGGAGDDILIGDAAAAQNFQPGLLNIAEDHTMTMTFDFEEAGYRNSVGTYKVDPDTGQISDVQMVWENASLAGSGGDLISGESSFDVELAAGDQVGFFLIGNGFSQNNFDALQGGSFEFVNANGDAASVNDGGVPTLRHVSADGSTTAINGMIYHSSATTNDSAINPDGIEHTLGYTDADHTKFQIGFEDLFNGGDRDFDDAMFTVDVGSANAAAILAENDVAASEPAGHDRLEGRTGEDDIVGHGGNDLLVGGGASTEWELVDGKWVYHPDRVSSEADPYMVADGADDVISGGDGDDVLIGNAGNDTLYGGAGEDLINAGVGNDRAFGGLGDDIINLEDGDDYAEAGLGADIVNAGDGDDIVYGDDAQENLLDTGVSNGKTIAEFVDGGLWEGHTGDDGLPEMSQVIETVAGESYTLKFDLAANLPAGVTAGAVEILWNGEVLETLTTNSGAFETHELEIAGTGEPGVLAFRNISIEGQETASSGPEIDTTGPIYSYEKTVNFGGEDMVIDAFAPGQAKLYQVISGQLKVFDPASNDYQDAGPATGMKINAIGFNSEDDLIYGIAKSDGVDSLGNVVEKSSLVAMDASGQAYLVGDTPSLDYVGDFDDQGNLWTFHASLDRIHKIDVDNFDGNGDPTTETIYLPKNLLNGNVQDIAYSAEEQAFYLVQAPSKNGGSGTLHKLDIGNLDAAGVPEISSIPISGTLFDGTMVDGMAKGAFGAVFLDGEGNLFAGLNKGDHDLDGSTAAEGAIYQIHYDFDSGQSYAEFKSTSQTTGSNDGAVDPRAVDPFAEVDQTATIQMRMPELTLVQGGDDDLRGGSGDDEMYGNAGDDTLHGGTGEDKLSGDEGADKIFGGADNDDVSGGLGADYIDGGTGDDDLSGDAGDDLVKGGSGDDIISGDEGADKLYGEVGADTIDGGAGDDRIFAGEDDDQVFGGIGSDTIDLGAGSDFAKGGSGDDFIQGKDGDDIIDGGAGADKIVGGDGSDTISGGAGNDHIWGGQWWKDGTADTFSYTKGGGKDTIHDFEVEHDQIDLSSYGLTFEDIQSRIIDRGWATEINLEGIDKSGAGDKIMLKSINPDDLNEENFII